MVSTCRHRASCGKMWCHPRNPKYITSEQDRAAATFTVHLQKIWSVNFSYMYFTSERYFLGSTHSRDLKSRTAALQPDSIPLDHPPHWRIQGAIRPCPCHWRIQGAIRPCPAEDTEPISWKTWRYANCKYSANIYLFCIRSKPKEPTKHKHKRDRDKKIKHKKSAEL